MKRYFATLSIITCLFSCNEDEFCGDPSDTFAVLKLIDADSKELLLCDDCVYHPDTIIALNSAFQFEAADSLIILRIYGLDAGIPLSLRLSSTETDTIRTSVGKKEFDCFDIPVLTAMTYNDELVFEGELYGATNKIITIGK